MAKAKRALPSWASKNFNQPKKTTRTDVSKPPKTKKSGKTKWSGRTKQQGKEDVLRGSIFEFKRK